MEKEKRKEKSKGKDVERGKGIDVGVILLNLPTQAPRAGGKTNTASCKFQKFTNSGYVTGFYNVGSTNWKKISQFYD